MKKFLLCSIFLLSGLHFSSALSCIDLHNDLKEGDETKEVISLQIFLLQKGFLTVEPNGYFGGGTLGAVMRYQDSLNLPDTGVVSSSEREAIFKETCNGQTSLNSNAGISPSAVIPTLTSMPTTGATFFPVSTSTAVISSSNPKTFIKQEDHCLNFTRDLVRGKENADVLSLQRFLMKKGLLMVAPNGYFGVSTFKAVKSYQESLGLSRSGDVKLLTRSAIKNETCTNNLSPIISSNVPVTTSKVSFPEGCTSSTGFSVITGASCSLPVIFNNGCTSFSGFSTTTGMSCSNSSSTSSPVSAVATTTSFVPVAPVVTRLSLTPNEKRQADTIALLSAMYSFYVDSRGTFPMPMISATPIEICTLGISLCANLNEVKSFLVPRFLTTIPTDPSISGSTGSGYFITRLSDGTVTVTAPSGDGGATIYAKCNFTSRCSITTYADDVAIQAALPPHIDSIDKAIFLSGGITLNPLVIHGSGFSTSSNMITLSLRGSSKKYTLGTFSSIDQKTINATSGFTISPFSCGVSCFEVLPVGYYDVTVKTQIGESNTGSISPQSVTSSSVSGSNARPLTPKNTHVKLGSVTLSSQTAVTLKSLTFSLAGTNILVSKLSNFTLTDSITGRTISSGPNFTIPNEIINNNATKLYDLYADIADIDVSYAGRIDITGAFTVNEAISNNLATIPVPKFIITVSY